jgi:hypothetical protein
MSQEPNILMVFVLQSGPKGLNFVKGIRKLKKEKVLYKVPEVVL